MNHIESILFFFQIDRLLGGGTYFKVGGFIHMKFQILVIFSFQITIQNCHYDIKSSIFQNYQLFSIFLKPYPFYHMHFNLVAVRLW